ncbi:trans-aconitate 2-methyltransferase [Geodermatophilus sp. YIM 151500]|uniref:trans-aconitate 2-methyltransferase n=1 Tax=Geodermatophilus sp. YIM 151500 TaxID=2984531 RepID=UPI0021E4F959|nr:trans-aconitate 2-methyltransferase [Geodermatophilus sp. YIM 151500]MCV2491748.1 trans-aconitate 2-methyltransferase [Geodermatophilus sp. YIM 151500]
MTGTERSTGGPGNEGGDAGVGGAGAGGSAAWDPGTYLRYADERARPFVELLARVRARTPRTVVDVGCGEGALTATLADRWPHARVTGIDSSPEMLAAAAAHARPDRVVFERGDVREWRAAEPVDVLVSNAVLHWVPGHPELLVRWAGELAPGGELAVQVPGNFRAPTHALLDELCRAPRWAARVGDVAPRPDAVLDPTGYLEVLEGAGLEADAWETTYLHVLHGPDPVLGWVRSTVLRPVLGRLTDDEADDLVKAYAALLRAAYPERPDGTTVLPFRRVFAVGRRPA